MARILCLTSNYPRWEGDSTTPFVLHLAQDLIRLGWEVDVLAPHAPGARRREVLRGVPVERFRYLWPERAQTVCYRGGALVNLRKNPLNKLKLPALVGAELVAAARRALVRPYDLVHSHWILPQGFVGAAVARLKPLPHVVTVHGGDVFGLRGALLEGIKRGVLRRAAAVTVNSSCTESEVRRIAPDLRCLARIPMGVDTAPADPDRLARAAELRGSLRSGAGPLLLFVGRMVDEKGLADLLHAVALLAPTLPDTRLLAVGEGQDRPALERLARDLGIAGRTRFAGWVDAAEVPTYLAAADIFVGPSRRGPDGWMEAQGLTFAEAMAAGTPVVATRHGGIVDTVIDGETGLLVAERAPDRIAAAVRRLYAEPELGRRLAERGRALVRERFSRPACAGAFSRLFASLLPPQGRPQP